MRQRLSLKARALQLLSQREHSRLELRRKLLAHAERLAENAAPGAAAGNMRHSTTRPAPGVDADARTDAGTNADANAGADDGADEGADEGVDDGADHGADGGGRNPIATRTRRAPPSAEIQTSVDTLLDELAASGVLSESRFVETRIRVRAARQGNLRIVQELARHGLQLSADEALALKASEFARAKQVWARKFGAPPVDAAGRARQTRFLAARGFSADVVRRLLRGSGEED